jgi:protein-disulfide isomerase
VRSLIAANPDLRVVVREYPILHPESVDAARMALAAAQQGRYAQFHEAMYRLGPPSAQTIAAAARDAGVNLSVAQAAIAGGAFDGQLRANVAMAQVLGINGTPGWVAGDRILQGALGREAIGKAVAEVRAS